MFADPRLPPPPPPADTCFWTLTKVKPSVTASGRGDAWGVLTWNGETATAGDAARVNGALKKVWRCPDGGGRPRGRGRGREIGGKEKTGK